MAEPFLLSKRFVSWKPKPTRLRNPLSTKPLKTKLLSTKLLHCKLQSKYVDGDPIRSGA